MIRRHKRGQRLKPGNTEIVLKAIRQCRLTVLQASLAVQRDCPVDHALLAIARAIDALQEFLTHKRTNEQALECALRDDLRLPSRNNRPSVLDDPNLLLGDLRACRNVLNQASANVIAFGTTYEMLSMVTAAISALSVLLTGNSDHFNILSAGAPDGQRDAHRLQIARERGDAEL